MKQQVKPGNKRKRKVKVKAQVEFAELGDIASAKEKDFDLDLTAATYTAKKGQSGSRQRGVP